MVRKRNILSRLERQIARAPPMWTVQRYLNSLFQDNPIRANRVVTNRNPRGAIRYLRGYVPGANRIRDALREIRNPAFRARMRAVLRRIS